VPCVPFIPGHNRLSRTLSSEERKGHPGTSLLFFPTLMRDGHYLPSRVKCEIRAIASQPLMQVAAHHLKQETTPSIKVRLA
jgi:hypothetical protein